MISVLAVVLAGVLVARWTARALVGWRAYPAAVLAALVLLPPLGYLVASIDALWQDGGLPALRGTAIGLALAVALIEVPLLVFRFRRRAR